MDRESKKFFFTQYWKLFCWCLIVPLPPPHPHNKNVAIIHGHNILGLCGSNLGFLYFSFTLTQDCFKENATPCYYTQVQDGACVCSSKLDFIVHVKGSGHYW